MGRVTTRDERILDAAIEVIAEGGMRRLTHRAVDAAAGLAMGSTSNRYRTRDDLLVGVLRRMLARESAIWNRREVDLHAVDVDGLANALGDVVGQLADSDSTLSRARQILFATAASEAALSEEITAAHDALVLWVVPLLERLGSTAPAEHADHLLALVDGLLAHQLAIRAEVFDPATPLAALLRGLFGEASPTR